MRRINLDIFVMDIEEILIYYTQKREVKSELIIIFRTSAHHFK